MRSSIQSIKENRKELQTFHRRRERFTFACTSHHEHVDGNDITRNLGMLFIPTHEEALTVRLQINANEEDGPGSTAQVQ